MDEVDAFIADLNIDGLNDDGAEKEASPEEAEKADITEEDDGLFFDDSDLFEDRETRMKANPGLLVIFLIFAIPLGLAGIVLMLAFAALSLGLAAATGFLGVYAVVAAFRCGLDILADILIAFGLAVILFALTALFLWMAVWFCAGAIPGIIRGIKALAEKWCCMEVAV